MAEILAGRYELDEVVGRGVAGEAALRVTLGVVERHDQTGPAHRVKAGVDGQLVRSVGDRDQRRIGARGAAVVVIDRRHQRVALGGQPVHRLLGLTHQVYQPRCVATPDLAAARNTVRSCE